MKYAISFHRGFRHFDKIDEIIFKYTDKNTNLLDAFEGRENWQRFIIDVTERTIIEEDLVMFNLLRKKYKFAIKPSIVQRELAADLYEENIPFFFEEFADTWDKLASMVGLGVSDVYIVADLGFDLKDVSAFCKQNKVKVRVFPNIAQVSSKVDNLDSFHHFFIRPEDVEIYSEYIDVLEFFGDLDRQSVLYEIYTKGKWVGKLNELILNFKSPIDNQTIPPIFAEKRLDCGKKCLKGKCKICTRIKNISSVLQENNLVIRKAKDNENTINVSDTETITE